MIEPSEGTPPEQGHEHIFSFNITPDATMYSKGKKRRTEAQRHHDALLIKSRYNPTAYRDDTMEEMAETVKQQRERAHAAKADAENSQKALIGAQNQVHSSANANEGM
jgi:hypothetical protein